MAGGSRFILILGFFCIFKASDNRNVHHGTTVIKHKGVLNVDDILSKIPITLPDGIDPSHINVTSITLKTCSGLEEQLMMMQRQLQETTVRNNKLNEEFFKLMVNTRVLKTQLATCSATASAVAGSYHTQLSNKMKQLLETFDTDAFLILKMIVLNREIKTLEKKISAAANSTADATEITELQNELQDKMNKLNRKKEQIKGSHTDSALILQIIELQNQIWDLEQEESRRGEAGQQQQQRITVLQEQLNRTISELRRRGDSSSVVLELISVQSKIAATQKLIHIHIKKSKDNAADYQRQLKQKSDLLKKKILQLNRDESNVELTQEILILQAEVMRLRQLTMNSKTIIDSQLQVLKDIVEEAKKQQEILEKQLEEMDYAQSQLILRIISMMEELRDLHSDVKQTTSTGQETTLEAVLQAKDREYAKAQAEIKELQEKLQEKSKECSGLEIRYKNVKTEFEEKIAELNRRGQANTALILTVINLHNELNTLKDLISTTKDPDAISDLQRQLEEKQAELNSKNEDIQRLITNPEIVLTIIKLQNEIHDLQSKPSNETTSNHIKYLQQRVDGFLTEIDDRNNENTKQLLKIVTLQNQVQRLQKQLSELKGLRDSETKQLTNDLVTKKKELQGFVDELHQKNQTNAILIITVTELQVQLRNLEEERRNDTLVSSLTITELQDKLRAKMAAQSRDQAEIKTLKNLLQDKESERASAQEKVTELQKNLQEKSEECSGLEIRYKNAKTEFEKKIAELNRRGQANTALILTVINLHNELNTLKDLISTTKDPDAISDLQRQLEEKQTELNSKNEEIQRLITNPEIVLTIIKLQNEIHDLQSKPSNETTSNRIKYLQQRVDGFLTEIDDRNNENTKQLLKIVTLQNQVQRLQKQLSELEGLRDSETKQLTNDLVTKKKELQGFVDELHQKNQTNAILIITVTELQVQLRNLEEERRNDTLVSSLTITELQDKLRAKMAAQSRDQAEIKTLKNLLQDKESERASAQEKVTELQKNLQEKSEECSGLEIRYKNAKTEFEKKIAELNRRGQANTALILTVINLHNELNTLKDLISTTKDPDAISDLQRQLEEKQTELNSKNEDIQRLITNPEIVLTIIKLQNEIHDLQSKPSNETTSNHIKYLQQRVDGFLTEIDDRNNENTKQLLKIVTLQNQVQRLQKQLSELKGLRDSETKQLTNDLVTKKKELQGFVDELHQKNQTNAILIITVTELQVQLRNLEEERRNDTLVSSLTITELQDKLRAKMAAQSRDQAEIKTLKNLLQDKESERASAQEKVTELQKNLQEKSEECSGLEERYENVKTEFEEKIAELNRTGQSNTALILTVINLHNELNTLKDLISTTKDPDAISDLQRQLEEKQAELNSKNEEIQRLITNPEIVLEIIELQNKIWDLQQNATDGTASNRVKELQTRLDNLISGVNDKGNENTKLMLKILTLQSQVDQLQRQLSKLQSVKNILVNQLKRDLTTKENELQKNVDELNEKKNTNAELILSVTNLNNQLRKLQEAKRKESQTASAKITDLEKKLYKTEAQCSNYEQQLKNVQNDLDDKIKELQAGSDSITSLTLQISTLTLQLEELKQQLQKTNSKAKIKELEKQIEEKDKELAKLTEQLKMRSSQPQRLLQIISIQTEIEKFVNMPTNESNYFKIQALEDNLKYLIEGIQDDEEENTKLVVQVLAQRDKIERLQKIKDSETKAATQKIKDLENELETIRKQIEEKTRVLNLSGARVANLSAQIMELHSRIKPLKDEISDLKEEQAERLAELQRQLDLSKRQLQDSELRLRDAESKKFDLIMDIAALRGQLKKAQKTASAASRKNVNELENQLENLQNDNKKLEATNKDLKQEVQELTTCCNDELTQCNDLQKQLKESQDLVDHLGEQLAEKEKIIKNHQQTQHCDQVRELQQQLREKDLSLSRLQQDFDDLTVEKNNLQEQNRNLQNEKNKLEGTVQELQDKINDVEDKTIQPKKMTFDPNTAHPRIILSAQDTEMSTSDQPQDVPDNPGRYNVLLAALSKTGFSSGRNYWEISVAEKICFHLGMASESANRRGPLTFNPEHGYWTIVLNKQGIYKALDSRYSVIQVQRQPLTIGVLLDYKKGQISFYDSGARSHIYTFSGQKFHDRIYLFVNFCVEEAGNPSPLTLLTPGSVDWIK